MASNNPVFIMEEETEDFSAPRERKLRYTEPPNDDNKYPE